VRKWLAEQEHAPPQLPKRNHRRSR
jgi:hypothetical protein